MRDDMLCDKSDENPMPETNPDEIDPDEINADEINPDEIDPETNNAGFERAEDGPPVLHEQLYLGCAGWSYNDWRESFYPEKTASADRLSWYATQFRSVEIDSTFYGIPRLQTVQGWYQKTPSDFIFSPKFPRAITHEARLVGCAGLTTTFVETMQELGPKLGPMLLQLPPSFRADRFDDLARFLEGLPDGLMYAVEVRDRSWLNEAYAQLLRRWGVAMVLTCGSHLGRFWRATSRVAYIRWLGKHGAFPGYDHIQTKRDEEIAWWSARMAHFLHKGGVIFGYANNNYEGFAPSSVRRVEHQIAAEMRTGGEPPVDKS